MSIFTCILIQSRLVGSLVVSNWAGVEAQDSSDPQGVLMKAEGHSPCWCVSLTGWGAALLCVVDLKYTDSLIWPLKPGLAHFCCVCLSMCLSVGVWGRDLVWIWTYDPPASAFNHAWLAPHFSGTPERTLLYSKQNSFALWFCVCCMCVSTCTYMCTYTHIHPRHISPNTKIWQWHNMNETWRQMLDEIPSHKMVYGFSHHEILNSSRELLLGPWRKEDWQIS